jgi:ABC-type lipoprotein export system ATPase subunit
MAQRWWLRNPNKTVLRQHMLADRPAPQPLIDLSRVVKTYQTPAGAVPALTNVDLQVHAGEFVAVIGKSGSGKSTLINFITGIDRPTSGTVHVAGTPIHTLNENRLALWRGQNLGVIFQFFQLLPTLTLIENVMLPMELARLYTLRERRERAMDLLNQVGLVDKADRRPAMVSGGQQQRAAIARALANDPSVIVADEPTGSLDARTADAVFGIFEQFVNRGKTILMVTHDRDLASRVSRVILIAEGEIMDQQVAHALPALSQQEMVALAARLEPATYPAGAVIIRQGEPADRFFIVLKGKVEVVLEQDGSHELVIDRRISGEFFGEIGLLQGGQRTATVRAAVDSDAVVVSLDRGAFNKLMDGSDPTRDAITSAMRERLLNLQDAVALKDTYA